MPELPDVETWKRYVDSTALHQRIEDAEVTATRMLRGASASTVRRRLVGASFARTARHGKYLFVALGETAQRWLLLHFGMTGRLAYFKDGGRPPHTELLIRFANGASLACIWQRRLGRIGLAEEPEAFVCAHGLGPDAFSPGIPLADFRAMLARRRGSVKSALMDQGFIAGIGNVYSDEMLFQARIHPRAAAAGLTEDQTAALHRALRHVLRIAIERQADAERMPETWLLPHRSGDGACPRCGAALERVAIVGRHAVLCPRCQRQP